jgi:hypothetical protein
LRAGWYSGLFILPALLATRVTQATDLSSTNAPGAIPWSQIGAKAGANYQGDGLTVTPTESGARLHCVFQRLDGEATRQGLWLTSTVTNAVSGPSAVTSIRSERSVDRFRVTAAAVGRGASERESANATRTLHAERSDALRSHALRLPDTGTVVIDGQTVRFSRPGLTEEYSVSMDGVRQDFVVMRSEECRAQNENLQPEGVRNKPQGELVVTLAVSGARVEATTYGAQLVLEQSGRKIAYSRLRVTDAAGKELPARIEVQKPSAFSLQPSAFSL